VQIAKRKVDEVIFTPARFKYAFLCPHWIISFSLAIHAWNPCNKSMQKYMHEKSHKHPFTRFFTRKHSGGIFLWFYWTLFSSENHFWFITSTFVSGVLQPLNTDVGTRLVIYVIIINSVLAVDDSNSSHKGAKDGESRKGFEMLVLCNSGRVCSIVHMIRFNKTCR